MYEYRAKVKRVVDGDTLDLEVDLGFTVKVDIRARLFGIDTPEIHGVKKESEEYQRGMAAKDAVVDWLDDNQDELDQVMIRSYDGAPISQGKYGRWLVEVRSTLVDSRGVAAFLNDFLVEQGHAVRKEY